VSPAAGPAPPDPTAIDSEPFDSEPFDSEPFDFEPVESRPDDADAATEPVSIVPGMVIPAAEEPAPATGPATAAKTTLDEAVAVIRRYPLESVVVFLTGIVGLVYPFPLWLIGGLLGLASRRWDVRDKWMALAGPPGFALAGVIVAAFTGLAHRNIFSAFGHAFSADIGLLLRAGCVLVAAYLVWRIRRGPRRRRVPGWQPSRGPGPRRMP
jgi:hypothetical protein